MRVPRNYITIEKKKITLFKFFPNRLMLTEFDARSYDVRSSLCEHDDWGEGFFTIIIGKCKIVLFCILQIQKLYRVIFFFF